MLGITFAGSSRCQHPQQSLCLQSSAGHQPLPEIQKDISLLCIMRCLAPCKLVSVAYRCKQVPASPEESLLAAQAQPLGHPQELQRMSGLTLPQALQLHLFQGRVAWQSRLLTGKRDDDGSLA